MFLPCQPAYLMKTLTSIFFFKHREGHLHTQLIHSTGTDIYLKQRPHTSLFFFFFPKGSNCSHSLCSSMNFMSTSPVPAYSRLLLFVKTSSEFIISALDATNLLCFCSQISATQLKRSQLPQLKSKNKQTHTQNVLMFSVFYFFLSCYLVVTQPSNGGSKKLTKKRQL